MRILQDIDASFSSEVREEGLDDGLEDVLVARGVLGNDEDLHNARSNQPVVNR